MVSRADEISVDVMMVADGAQAVGGKLYILGGAWDHLLMPDFPSVPAPFSVAVGIRVPWHLTNRRFAFSLEFVDADGNQVIPPATGDFEAGRPPGLRAGTPQRVLFTFTLGNIEIPQAGRYVFNALVDGEHKADIGIEIVQRPV